MPQQTNAQNGFVPKLRHKERKCFKRFSCTCCISSALMFETRYFRKSLSRDVIGEISNSDFMFKSAEATLLVGRPRGIDRDLLPPAPEQGAGASLRRRCSCPSPRQPQRLPGTLWKTSSSSVGRWLRTLSKVVNAHNSYSKKRGTIKHLNINMQEGDG